MVQHQSKFALTVGDQRPTLNCSQFCSLLLFPLTLLPTKPQIQNHMPGNPTLQELTARAQLNRRTVS